LEFIFQDRSAQFKASIWKLPASDSKQLEELECLCELTPEESLAHESCRSLDWHPSREGSLATVLDGGILTWTLDGGSPRVRVLV
jgi:hypothetical protein